MVQEWFRNDFGKMSECGLNGLIYPTLKRGIAFRIGELKYNFYEISLPKPEFGKEYDGQRNLERWEICNLL
jgi:hypothetical protein